MKDIEVLIVEDQVLIAESIAVLLEKHSLNVSGHVQSGEEALEFVRKQSPDLVLMDIKLDGKIDGIQTAKRIQSLVPIPIIYLTDFVDKKTFDRAKETHPANYLAKPFSGPNLIRAIDLAIFNQSPAGTARPLKDSIFVRLETQRYIRIPFVDIEFLEAGRSYCTIATTTGKYKVSISLNHVYEQLDASLFLRVHRSIVVNLSKIKELDGNMLILSTQKVQMGGEYREGLLKELRFLK